MSPAPRRGKKGRAAATAEATKRKPGKKRAPVVEEDEDDEEEQPVAKKSGKRVAKDYGVTGEQLAEWRDENMGWQEIMDEVGAKSAIPLRKILHAYLAEQDEEEQLDIDDGDAIVAARDDEGMGWSQIAARADATVAEVKAAYKEAGGENLDGRAYKAKDGTVHFKLGQNGKAELEDEEEDEEDLEDEEDEDEEEEVVVKPRSRKKGGSTATKPTKKPSAKKATVSKPTPAARPRGRRKK